ncbi:MAG: bifunctional diaminohydroxyphosphoribosylaminopyrimidine deaminase/5-amino-6-(5-phosphoribosylamino)uracil reductase RibD [Pseudomonadales bacterium]
MSALGPDHAFMREALAQAESGIYRTWPNPSVGAVVVVDGQIIGRGTTARPGGPHAEVTALAQAGARARGATLYVTLEPCNHYGRTPPCVDAILAAGIARVVVAGGDPHPQVAGAGLARLREAGIVLTVGVEEDAAELLNAGFLSLQRRGRPLVRLKLAASLDGRTAMASGESQWITGPEARQDVQRWRARSPVLMTGVGTVLADDPRLTLRLAALPELDATDRAALAERPHHRVVLDRHLRTPPTAQLFSAPGVVLFHGPEADPARARALEEAGASLVALSAVEAEAPFDAVGAWCAARNFGDVLLECGPTLAAAALSQNAVDEVLMYQAPLILGADARPLAGLTLATLAEAKRFTLFEHRQIGTDLRLRLRYSADPTRS